MTIEEREAAIRALRQQQIARHPGLSPQERRALQESGWTRNADMEHGIFELQRAIEEQRKGTKPAPDSSPFAWKRDLSGFESAVGYRENVRCDISDSVYTGEFRGCQRHGKGTLKFDGGGVYAGEFVDDSFCGKGTQTAENGDRYVGEFKNNQKHGAGTMFWYDGRRYEGQFRSDRITGFGVMHWQDGRRYQGFFHEDSFDGEGSFHWPDGTSLDAAFKAGRAVEGLLKEASGCRYRVRYGPDKPGEKVSRQSLMIAGSWGLRHGSTNLMAYGTLPEPTVKEPVRDLETA